MSAEFALPHGGTLRLGGRVLVMGIVNVTPDSFSDGGLLATTESALAHAQRLVTEGADLLDVGAESTRPGARERTADEQNGRLLPLIAQLAARFPCVPVSVDTRSAEVARAAIDAGAAIVNDVSGLAHDPLMRSVVAGAHAPAIVMHLRGTPADMTTRTDYDDVVADVRRELGLLLDAARAQGVTQLVADPGIGFAKTAAQSLELLARLDAFHALGVPLLSGPSRKSFLRPFSDEEGAHPRPPAEARRDTTVAAAALSAFLGASIVRVHDVAACRGAVALAGAARRARAPDRS